MIRRLVDRLAGPRLAEIRAQLVELEARISAMEGRPTGRRTPWLN